MKKRSTPLSRVKLVHALVVTLFISVPAACENEDLKFSAACGDGVVGFGEACDGAPPPGVTCESLGHHDGEVRCGADCRLDVTGCRRCGDGVLDADRGELYEVGPETCWRNGYLGGDHQTPDCRFFHPETCVPYRTVSQDPPVSRPILGLDSRGRLWLSGLARGAFTGYTERPGCPNIHQYWEDFYSKGSWSEFLGYAIDPACDQEFLALYDDEARLQVLDQTDEAGNVGRVLTLTDGEVVLVRRTATYTAFIAVDAQGVRRRTTHLDNAQLTEPWSVTPLQDGRLGVVRPTYSYLEIRVMDPWRRVDSVNFMLGREFEYEGTNNQFYCSVPDGIPDHFGTGLPVAWESSDTVSLIIGVERAEGQGASGLYWVRLQREDFLARVTHLVPLPSPGDGLTPFHLHVDPDAGTFTVAWKYNTGLLHLQSFTWSGEPRASWRYTPRPDHFPEAFFPTPDGGVVVAGRMALRTPSSTNDATCTETGSGYYVERLGAQGVRLSEASFTAPGVILDSSWGQSEYEWLCDIKTRAWVFDGERVTVGGTHLASYTFCDRSEIYPTYNGETFLICDIHLVRLTP